LDRLVVAMERLGICGRAAMEVLLPGILGEQTLSLLLHWTGG